MVVFTGDAGFWYHIAEVETAVRWNLASVTVVNNNGGGNQSKRGFDRAGAVASAMGCLGDQDWAAIRLSDVDRRTRASSQASRSALR